ncbi:MULTISPECIES: hypothetical protein [unclassified Variovorax]|uniref:hypothetical protein n=1 Tax=unclassified Variovorax TaxID=663243 RepID=UPI003F47A6D9
MRHFHLRRQPHEPLVRASAHVPNGAPAATAEAPAADTALDQAAALWTTRRIRSFLVLQPAHGTRR